MRSDVVTVFLFKQKTAYEMRISDWSSDVCSSDLRSWRSDARSGYERRFHERQRAGEAENQRLQLQGIERELREQNRLEMQRRLRTAPEPARRIPGARNSVV